MRRLGLLVVLLGRDSLGQQLALTLEHRLPEFIFGQRSEVIALRFTDRCGSQGCQEIPSPDPAAQIHFDGLDDATCEGSDLRQLVLIECELRKTTDAVLHRLKLRRADDDARLRCGIRRRQAYLQARLWRTLGQQLRMADAAFLLEHAVLVTHQP